MAAPRSYERVIDDALAGADFRASGADDAEIFRFPR